jgi:hypothetical protein
MNSSTRRPSPHRRVWRSVIRRRAPSAVPARINFNVSLFKQFRFKERANLRFGAEFYNAFNHTQFHDLNTSFGNSAFGQVVDTYDPRDH